MQVVLTTGRLDLYIVEDVSDVRRSDSTKGCDRDLLFCVRESMGQKSKVSQDVMQQLCTGTP